MAGTPRGRRSVSFTWTTAAFVGCAAILFAAAAVPGTLAHGLSPHEHDCVYDDIIAGDPEVNAPTRENVNYAEANVRAAQRSDLRARSTSGVKKSQRKLDGSEPYPPAGYAPIRIHIDTSNLEDDRTCLRNGQRVAVGSPSSSTRVCGGAISTNCYVDCTDAEVLTAAKRDYIVREIAPRAEAMLEGALAVVPVDGPLQLSITECGSSLFGRAAVPSSYRTSGISNTDVIIFLTAHPTIGSNIAYALHCAVDSKGRPLAGHFNWGPNQIDASKFDLQLGVAVHEITHALAMASGLYPQFIDPVTNERISYRTSGTELTGNGASISVDYISTPLVKQAVSEHFNCDAAIGGQLENQGGAGTRGSHWEKRLYQNEFMTGTASTFPIFSKITLALFEDSGWYKANFTAAVPLHWGRNLGCNFLNRGCNSTNWDRAGYYCDTPQTTSCTFDFRSRGVCGLVTHSTGVPDQFQLFSDTSNGGFEVLADYCPYYTSIDTGVCTNSDNASPSDSRGQGYGAESRCFFSSLADSALETLPSPLDGACYRHACTRSEDLGVSLKVELGGVWYDCPDDMRVKVAGFHGTVICPNNEVFCDIASDGVYNTDFPVLDGIVPQRGPVSGGTRITLYGDNFDPSGTFAVDVGDIPCRAVQVKTRNEIQCVTPRQELDFLQTSQKFDIFVTDNDNRRHIIKDAFTYSPASRVTASSSAIFVAIVTLCLTTIL